MVVGLGVLGRTGGRAAAASVAYAGTKTFVTEIYGRPGGALPAPSPPIRVVSRPARTRAAPAVVIALRPPPPSPPLPPALPAPPPLPAVTTTTLPGVVTPVLFAPAVRPLETAAHGRPRAETGWAWRMALVLLATAAAHGLHRRY